MASTAVEGLSRRSPQASIPKPVAGLLFRQAARLDGAHTQRGRLLALIAAYADAGCDSPPFNVLLGPLGIEDGKQLDALLRQLQREGLLRVRWGSKAKRERNVYRVRLDAPRRGRRGRS